MHSTSHTEILNLCKGRQKGKRMLQEEQGKVRGVYGGGRTKKKKKNRKGKDRGGQMSSWKLVRWILQVQKM